jgi:hypothetical protein
MGCTLLYYRSMKHNAVARLQEIYYSVFTSAGSDHPKMQKYHTCFASHLPPLHKQSGTHSLTCVLH